MSGFPFVTGRGLHLPFSDEVKNLTVFTVVEELTFDEYMAALRESYTGAPTANVLCDMPVIEGNRISPEELRKIIAFIKQHENKRPRGKMALVSTTDLDYDLSRMSGSYAEIGKLS